MPSSARPLLRCLPLLLCLPLVGCGGEDPMPSGERPVLAPADNPDVAAGVADPTSPRIINVLVEDGRLTGDTGVVQVKLNVPVRMTVISDKTDTLRVEGYDVRALATAGVPVQLELIADEAGEFRIVLEKSQLLLTRLQVG